MPYNIFRCFCKTFGICSNTSLKPRYVAFLPHILMLVKNEIFRFLPQSNFLTTEFFNEEFLARSSFLVKNFLQNQSSTSQLYIALSAINKYEILFWTDSSENSRKLPNLQNPPLQIIFQIWSEKIENLNFLKQILQQSQNASSSETRPLSPVFPHTYLFTIVWELLKNSIFFILKSLFLDLKMPQLFEDTFFSTRWVPNEEFFWKIKIFKS